MNQEKTLKFKPKKHNKNGLNYLFEQRKLQ